MKAGHKKLINQDIEIKKITLNTLWPSTFKEPRSLSVFNNVSLGSYSPENENKFSIK